MPTVYGIILLLVILVSIILATHYLWISKQYRNLKNSLSAKEDDIFRAIAYFYKNPGENIEESSPGLKEILGLEKGVTLEQLRAFFRPSNPGVLGNLLGTLNDGKSTARAILKVPKSKRFLQCHGRRLNDEEGHLSGIILYFEDITELQLSQQERSIDIHHVKEEFKALLDVLNTSPYPMWQRNKELDIVYCNFAYLKMIREQLMHITDNEGLELYPQANELSKKLSPKIPTQTERKHLVLDGERRLFKITETRIDNNIIMGFARDISEQENIEKELSLHLSAQSNFLESSTSATAIFGSDRRIQFFNSAYVNLWKLDENWLEQKPRFSEIYDTLREKRKLPEQIDFSAFKRSQLELFTNLIDSHEEFFYLPDGTVIRVIVIPYATGGLIFTYEDITDRIALEQSYNTLLAVKQATIDNLHEGVAVFGEDGRIQLYNPVYADMWQLKSDILDNNPHISDIIDHSKFLYDFGDDWNQFKTYLIAQSNARQYTSEKLMRMDGSVIDWACVPLPDGATLMIYEDVTDSYLVERSLRAEKEALQEADTLKSHFLANVSYELRSPLTSIRGFSESLLAGYLGEMSNTQKEYIEGIHHSSLSLTSLIDDILDMASINAGYMTLSIEEFDLYKALCEIVPLIEVTAREKHVKFMFKCPKDIGTIRADRKRICQIVTNLINNAFRLTEPSDVIMLEIKSHNEKEIMIVVKDTGKGIPEKDRPVIFEQFYRSNIGQGNQAATSLALPIVKSLIELHGGNIELESDEGTGTSIVCYLLRNSEEHSNTGLNSDEQT